MSSPEGSGPHSEVVLYRGNPWLGRGKPLFHSPVPKISLIYELLNEQRIRYKADKNRFLSFEMDLFRINLSTE